jgi:diaminopimelate epimerase
MTLRFHKYQGTGNDFILLDNRDESIVLSTQQIASLCDRRFGIGADGLMLLEPDTSTDFKMVYYNSDGRESTMCGNGGRCISVFAHILGVSGNTGKFMAIDGEHDFEILDNGKAAKLKMIDVNEIEYAEHAIILFTGSPHYVTFRNNIKAIDIVPEARAVRYNDRFAHEGINVNFVEVAEEKVSMRTYERGVEDETLSCGTGTVAVALSVALKYSLPVTGLEIQTPGGQLYVHFKRNGDSFTDIWLEGPVEHVFEGTISIA